MSPACIYAFSGECWRCRVINKITVHVEVARHSCGHIEHLIHRVNLHAMLVSSVVIEIKISFIDQILDHFVCHSVQESFACGFVWM
jgi:hypothetical protein